MRTLLLALTGCVVLVAGQQTNCDQIRFQACSSNLAQALGVDASILWNDANQLTQVLRNSYRQNDATGITQTCNSLLMFYQCLGQQNIGICLGPIGFLRRGKSPADAYAFDGLLSVYRFQCGAGFYAVVGQANGTCVQSTYTNYASQIDAFFTSYKQNITNDPNNACNYQWQLSNGVGNIFQSGPCRIPFGTSPGFPWWFGCEGAKEYTLAQFRHCATVNPSQSSSAQEAAQQNVRFKETGEPEFLLPATWTQDKDNEWTLNPARWI